MDHGKFLKRNGLSLMFTWPVRDLESTSFSPLLQFDVDHFAHRISTTIHYVTCSTSVRALQFRWLNSELRSLTLGASSTDGSFEITRSGRSLQSMRQNGMIHDYLPDLQFSEFRMLNVLVNQTSSSIYHPQHISSAENPCPGPVTAYPNASLHSINSNKQPMYWRRERKRCL
jgi:hypothetical protein